MLSKWAESFRKVSGQGPGTTNKPRVDQCPARETGSGTATFYHKVAAGPRDAYRRPHFLGLIPAREGEVLDHATRPVVVPSDATQLPVGAGYAECINGGKSSQNEDSAAVASIYLHNQPNGSVGCRPPVSPNITQTPHQPERLQVHYFGLFDGHAGAGASLMAASQFINHLQEHLVRIQEHLFRLQGQEGPLPPGSREYQVSQDSLVTGALESAFLSFDEQIATERLSTNISGGCAAIVTLVVLGKVYVAHAGDCRAVAYIGNDVFQMSSEFTPETDAERIQSLAHLKPELTHSLFSDNYFLHSLGHKDIGHYAPCRGPMRHGWIYKEITEEDVQKPPLVSGQGKWARLMGIIGVTRGFGDYDLVIPNTNIHVKPFLTAVPQVRVLNLTRKELTAADVLVVGCDGLWDLLDNQQVGAALKESLRTTEQDQSSNRLTRAARDLVLLARGENTGRGWKMKDGRDSSFDDISVFVIPLQHCLTSTLPVRYSSAKTDSSVNDIPNS